MTDLLEVLMIFCFGLSWPISIRKSWVSRTAKGKSLFFEVFLLVGYICGIVRKIMLSVFYTIVWSVYCIVSRKIRRI